MGINRLGLVFAKIRGKQKVLQRFPECCKDFHVPTEPTLYFVLTLLLKIRKRDPVGRQPRKENLRRHVEFRIFSFIM